MPAKRQTEGSAAKWYLADIVMETKVAGDPRSVVHVNTVLVSARSADEAYAAAVKLGREGQLAYHNEQGDAVRSRFRGLRDLFEVFDRVLEHGSELIYSEEIGLPEAEVRMMVRSKRRLAVFSHVAGRVPGSPDYMSGDIARGLRAAGFDPKAERPPERKRRKAASKPPKRRGCE